MKRNTKMTAKQRQFASESMKVYWARKRKSNVAPNGTDPLISIVRQLQQRRGKVILAIAALEDLAA